VTDGFLLDCLFPGVLAEKATRDTGQIRSRTKARGIRRQSIRLLLGIAFIPSQPPTDAIGWRRGGRCRRGGMRRAVPPYFAAAYFAAAYFAAAYFVPPGVSRTTKG
jgi:hypothetical protein